MAIYLIKLAAYAVLLAFGAACYAALHYGFGAEASEALFGAIALSAYPASAFKDFSFDCSYEFATDGG